MKNVFLDSIRSQIRSLICDLEKFLGQAKQDLAEARREGDAEKVEHLDRRIIAYSSAIAAIEANAIVSAVRAHSLLIKSVVGKVGREKPIGNEGVDGSID